MTRVVIVGCGGMSAYWMNILTKLEDVQVVGFCDQDVQRAEDLAKKYSFPESVRESNLSALIKQTHPDIVIDLTPPSAHEYVAKTAFENNCHVFAEKPLAETFDQAKELLAAGSQKDLLHAVMQNRRYDSRLDRFRELLKKPELGKFDALHADFFTAPKFDGFRRDMAHVLLLDMAIHHFDAARYILNAEPVSVSCNEWTPPDSWFRDGPSVVAFFQMTDNKVFTYRGSWSAEGFPTTWECAWRAQFSEGCVHWDGADALKAVKVVEHSQFESKTEPIEPPAVSESNVPGGHEGCIQDVFACFEQGRQPMTRASDNIKSLAMVSAAIESAETGRKVEIATMIKDIKGD